MNWYVCLFIQIDLFNPVQHMVSALFFSDMETETQSGEATCPEPVLRCHATKIWTMVSDATTWALSTPPFQKQTLFHIHVFIYPFSYTLNKYALGMYC